MAADGWAGCTSSFIHMKKSMEVLRWGDLKLSAAEGVEGPSLVTVQSVSTRISSTKGTARYACQVSFALESLQ